MADGAATARVVAGATGLVVRPVRATAGRMGPGLVVAASRLTFSPGVPHLVGTVPRVLLPGQTVRAAIQRRPSAPVGPLIGGRHPSSAFLAPGARRAHLEGAVNLDVPAAVAAIRTVVATTSAGRHVPVAVPDVASLAARVPHAFALRPLARAAICQGVVAGAT